MLSLLQRANTLQLIGVKDMDKRKEKRRAFYALLFLYIINEFY